MLKLFVLLALTLILILQFVPAYCASKTAILEVSAVLPEHVMLNSHLAFSGNLHQLVQTETVIRNNRSVVLTSIVVP